MNAYEAVIGLEIHAQLLTQSKVFCTAPNRFGSSENEVVGTVSAGLPGSLPVLNTKAVELAIRAGFALNCEVKSRSVFSRKNYFYPDLPKGYQISQFDEPICGEGFVDIRMEKSGAKRIGIERIHIEEDAGKSSHFASTTLVNLNRAGVPLIEIVSRPDLRSPEEAAAYMRKLHAILVYADICDGNLEEGNFRCDVNISIRPVGQKQLGTRTELKNINSFRFVEKATEYEIARQIALVEAGGKVVMETRGWDAAIGKTFSMRKKEEAHDYRYFPEPDLPPLILDKAQLDSIRSTMPELPEHKQKRFVSQFQLNEYDADTLTSSKELASFFEKVVGFGVSPKLAANWINSELLRELKEVEGDIRKSPLTAEQLAGLIGLIEKGSISGKIAKSVFEEMYQAAKNSQFLNAETIVKEKGLLQILDNSAIENWVMEVIQKNPAVVEDYKSGKIKVMGYLVGETMKLSQGKANPPLVQEMMKKKLES